MSAVNETCAWPSHSSPVDGVPLTVLADRACPYLPGRVETLRGFLCEEMPADVYHAFMDRAFRRSGRFFYQPVCRGCRECQPLRVPTATFRASKSQRRVWRRNGDVSVTVTPLSSAAGAPGAAGVARALATEEKFALYLRYQRGRHQPDRAEDRNGFAEFLYSPTVDSVEFAYRDAGGKLIGVGIGDLCARSLSSVYFYFDPDERRRSLGVFSAMWEIAFALRENIPHYYLGYWVRGCATMQYKSEFRPFEVLGPDGAWRGASNADDADSAPGDSPRVGDAGNGGNVRLRNWPAPAVEMP
jgi:arginine-tRNA-protein transferase